MADDYNDYNSMQLRGCEFVTEKRNENTPRVRQLRVGEKVHPRKRTVHLYGECNTLLPELAATEVVKCVQ